MKARQSTARTFMIGPILDGDGVAVTDGVVGDMKISKNGAAPAALDGSATLTHRHTGFYSLALTANDLDTVGTAQVTIDDTTNSCAMLNIQVVEEAVYDRDFAASATGIVGTAQTGDSYAIVNSGTHGNAALKTLIDAVDNFVDTEIGTIVTAVAAIETDTQDIQSRLPAALTAGGNIKADSLALSGSTTAADNAEVVFATDFATNYNTTSDGWVVKLGNYAHGGGSVDMAFGTFTVGGDVWTNPIQTLVSDLLNTYVGIAGQNLTGLGGMSDTMKGQVQTEVNDALVANNLDHLLLSAVDTDFNTTVHANSAFGYLASTANTYDRSTDSQEAIRNRGDAAWITATGFSTHSAADVWAAATRTLTAATNITSTGGTITVSSGSVSVYDFTAAAKALINAEVLDVISTDTLIDGKSIEAALEYIAAACAGRVSGAGTGTEVFKGLDEATTRLTITVDSSGNRSDIVYG